MSLEAITYIMKTHIPDGVAKLVAMVLADYADPVTGLCWPKIPTLAVQCSQSERTVQRKIVVLVELGVLRVALNTSGDRKGNRYYLRLPGVPWPQPGPGTGDRIAPEAVEPPPTGDRLSPVRTADGCHMDTPTGDTGVTPRVTLLSPPIENPPLESVSRSSPQPPVAGGREGFRKVFRGNGLAAPPVHPPQRRRDVAPDLDAGTATAFELLWAAYPEAARAYSDRPDAQRTFAELTQADRDLAIAAARAERTRLASSTMKPKALHTWLRRRRFLNLRPVAPAPTASGGPPARVFVREGTPEWDAWLRHERAQGRKPMPATWSQSERADGWWYPSLLPPAAEAA